MNELIKRAFEVRDSLRYCVANCYAVDCMDCTYYENGCRDGIMLDAAKVIERMIEEVGNG